MRIGVVLENGVMMKDTGRKWLIVFSFVARGRPVGLHAILQSGYQATS
jgi:hypothetical protein